jgi:hypothetical protein
VSHDVGERRQAHDRHVPEFIIHHRHDQAECGAVFASFQGFHSVLRRRPAAVSCAYSGHDIWWCVEADTEAAALELIPDFVAARSSATRFERTVIP